MNIDTVPVTLAGIFFLMLIGLWSIETIQQPNPAPYGPVRTYVGGATVTIVEPPIVNETGARFATNHAESAP